MDKEEISTQSKRKRVVLTLEEKLAVIKEKDSGATFDKVAEKFNIGTTTVKDIFKKRVEIEETVSKNLALSKRRKTLRVSPKEDVEKMVYDWICQKHEIGEIVTTSDLIAKAEQVNFEIRNGELWVPSKSWAKKFRERFNLTTVKFDEEEENLIEEYPVISRGDICDAADMLLDYINAHNFPLKEIITFRMIRDRILEIESNQEL